MIHGVHTYAELAELIAQAGGTMRSETLGCAARTAYEMGLISEEQMDNALRVDAMTLTELVQAGFLSRKHTRAVQIIEAMEHLSVLDALDHVFGPFVDDDEAE